MKRSMIVYLLYCVVVVVETLVVEVAIMPIVVVVIDDAKKSNLFVFHKEYHMSFGFFPFLIEKIIILVIVDALVVFFCDIIRTENRTRAAITDNKTTHATMRLTAHRTD